MSFSKSVLLRVALFASASLFALALTGKSFAQTATGAAGSHSAQTAEQSPSAADNGEQSSQELGEIVVTARKRKETVLDVPVVEIPITAAQLKNQQTEDLKDIAQFVPGLIMASTGGPSGTQISLRGVGTNSPGISVDAEVALNIDGLNLTSPIAYASAMFDLAQVEALKGPQALFYGKNSPGGVISLTTADPTDKFELYGTYGYESEAKENREELIISGPVSDSLKLRLATQYDTQDGWMTNNASSADPGTGGLAPTFHNAAGDQGYVVRGTALWEPATQFDARLKVNLTHDYEFGGIGVELVSCPDGTGSVSPRNIPFLSGATCKKGSTFQQIWANPANFAGLINGSGEPSQDTIQKYGTLELNYRPRPDITLTSVTGYYDMSFDGMQSGDASTFAGPALLAVNYINRHDVTEEVRANSDFAGPLNFTLGAFQQEGRMSNLGTLPGNSADGFPASFGSYRQLMDINSTSGFGQVRWKIIPTVEIAGGARWTHESRDLTVTNFITGKPVLFPTSVPRISSDNTSPEATLTYKPTERFTTFASYKQGFKSGTFNFTPPAGTLPDVAVGPERSRGEEVGAKTELLDNNLYMDVALYNYNYSGLQVGVDIPSVPGAPVSLRLLNAGAARVYGLDYDISYKPPINGLVLNGAVEWNHARFTDLNGVPCWGGQTITDGCNESLQPSTGLYTAQNLSGTPLLRAPTWDATFGFNYERPIGHDLTLQFSNVNQFSSRYLAVLGLNRSDFYQGSFIKTDVTVGLKGPNDRWEFAFIGKDLNNAITTGNCNNSDSRAGGVLGGEVTGGTLAGPAGVDDVLCYMDRGRELWLRVTLRPY